MNAKLEEFHSEHVEAQLQDLEQELREKIAEAKSMSRDMRTSLDND